METSDHLQRLTEQRISRRGVLRAGIVAGLGIAGLNTAACESKEKASDAVANGNASRGGVVPTNDEIFGDIESIVAQGVRRPGYPADEWTEQFCLQRFRDLGLENVRAEPVSVSYWEPRKWSLAVWSDSAGPSSAIDVPCFPLPHSKPTEGLEGRLVSFQTDAPGAVRGNVALVDIALTRVPYDVLRQRSPGIYDPEGTLNGLEQTSPFSLTFESTLSSTIAAGASAFVGSLSNYPGDSCEHYSPYQAIAQPIPCAWVSGSSSVLLKQMLSEGPVNTRLMVDSDMHPATSNNIVGELPGADDEIVVVGSHHDGAWASAVEDGSGTALVLAQAAYWSGVPQEDRPHRMLFLLHAAHLARGAGQMAFADSHTQDLRRTVLEVHLEHAALELAAKDGNLAATGQPEPRWWFTTPIPRLETTVLEAVTGEKLTRSIILPPTIFGTNPPTDAYWFNAASVPIVNFLAAPFYLFDSVDTLDKVDRNNLAALTRAAIRIIQSTRGETAKSMRDSVQPKT